MRTLRPLFAWLLLVSLLPAQQASRFGIGTWNLEFFGAAPQLRNDTPPRTDEDVAALGRMIKELGVAVLAVQEICGERPLQQLVAAIGPQWRCLLGTTGAWDDGQTQQGIGFVYDAAAVELLSAEELLDFPRENGGVAVFHRKPVTACFRHRASGCDFRLVTVHLKAGQKGADEEKRRLEATRLRTWLDGLLASRGEDPDVVVLGDFNAAPGAEPEQILDRGGAFTDLVPQRRVTSIVHFDAQIDHIAAARGFAELQRGSLVVHAVDGDAARRAFRKTYSDHFPLTATVSADRDDDPDATFALGPPAQRLPLSARPVEAAGAARPGATDTAWPPAVGARVLVRTSLEVIEGTLVAPVPEGPGGWLVVDVGEHRIAAVPLANVQALRLAR